MSQRSPRTFRLFALVGRPFLVTLVVGGRSGPTSTDQDCFNPAQTICRPRSESTLTEGVYLNAVEVPQARPSRTD